MNNIEQVPSLANLPDVQTALLNSAFRSPGDLLTLPVGLKLRGANIVPKPSDNGLWRNLYNNWDWAGWIKPQIDFAKSSGANSIRIIGDIGGVYSGLYTMATYLSRQKQFVEYCGKLGLYVYACGGSANATHLLSAPQSFYTSFLAQYTAFVSTYPYVFAIDVLQEVKNDPPPEGMTGITAAYAAVKAAAPNLPATFSQGFQVNTADIATYDAVMDFYDYHPYATDFGGQSAYDAFFAATAKPVLLGEFGSPFSSGTTAQVAYYDSIRLLAEHPEIIGAFSWAMTDQDTVANNQWGLYSATFVPRTALIAEFKTFPTRRRPWRFDVPAPSSVTVANAATFFFQQIIPQFSFIIRRPMLLSLRTTLDATLPGGSNFYMVPKLDGAFMTGSNVTGVTDAITGSTGRSICTGYKNVILAPGSHTLEAVGARIDGTNVSATFNATTTLLHAELEEL